MPALIQAMAAIPRHLALRKAAWSCLRQDRPVIIYTPPKSGSTSVEAGLAAARVPTLKIHFLSDRLEAIEERWRARGVPLDRHFLASRAVREALRRGIRPRFLTMVRDPIARLASADFQSRRAKGLSHAGADRHLGRIAGKVAEQAAAPLSWFREEIAPFGGIDLEAEGFDAARGWQRYQADHADVLIVKTARLDGGAEALSAFVGAPVRVGRENVRSQSAAAAMYKEVGDRLRLSADAVRQTMDDPLVRLFFTPEERAAMTARWTRAAEGD